MDGISNNFYIMLISLFYLALVSVFYFCKNKINNVENKIYTYLLLTSISELILNILASILAFYDTTHGNNILSFVIVRLYLVSCTAWIVLFTLYTLAITFSKRAYIYKLSIISNIILLVCVIWTFILPMNFNETQAGFFTSGPAVIITYGIGCFCLLICFYLMTKNLKNIKNKKYWPLYGLGLVCLFVGAIQYFNPTLLIISSAESFVSIIMYFSLENPDIKTIEKYQNNKEFSDKVNNEKQEFLNNIVLELGKPINEINKAYNILEPMEKDFKTNHNLELIMKNNKILNIIINNILDINMINQDKIIKTNDKYYTKKLFKQITDLLEKNTSKTLNVDVRIDKNIPEQLYGDEKNLKLFFNMILTEIVAKNSVYIDLTISEIVVDDVCRLIIMIDYSNKIIIDDTLNEIIEKMGGLLIVNNVSDEGEAIIILDQIIYEEKNQVTQKIESFNQLVKKNKILIISENNDYLNDIIRKLNKYDLLVDSTNLGAKGIEKVRNNSKYDYILLDEKIELIPVNQMLVKLKNIENFNSKLFVLTSNIKNNIYIKNGFDGVLNKKIKLREIHKLEETN